MGLWVEKQHSERQRSAERLTNFSQTIKWELDYELKSDLSIHPGGRISYTAEPVYNKEYTLHLDSSELNDSRDKPT